MIRKNEKVKGEQTNRSNGSSTVIAMRAASYCRLSLPLSQITSFTAMRKSSACLIYQHYGYAYDL